MEEVPAARDYQGGFHAELMVKDLGLAAAVAHECSAPLHMGRLAEQLYKQVTSVTLPQPWDHQPDCITLHQQPEVCMIIISIPVLCTVD